MEQGVVQQVTAEFMQAEKIVGGASSFSRSIQKIFKELNSLKGVIPWHRSDLYEEVQHAIKYLMKNTRTRITKEMINEFGEIVTIYKGKPTKINVDLHHIINFEVELVENLTKGGHEFVIKGGHYPVSCKLLEKTGLVNIKKIKTLKNGAKQYILENVFTGDCFPKTELIEEWGLKKSLGYALEILQDPDGVIDKAKKRGWYKSGVTKEGHKVAVIFDELEDGTIDLITFWLQ